MTRAASAAASSALKCSICLDTFNAPVITKCGHQFCEDCIRAALQFKKECPQCREPISSHRDLRADAVLTVLAGSTAARSIPPPRRSFAVFLNRRAAPSPSWRSCRRACRGRWVAAHVRSGPTSARPGGAGYCAASCSCTSTERSKHRQGAACSEAKGTAQKQAGLCVAAGRSQAQQRRRWCWRRSGTHWAAMRRPELARRTIRTASPAERRWGVRVRGA